MHSVGERIHTRRTQLGLSMGALARETGYSTTYVSRIESGDRDPPTITCLIKMATALQTTALWLLTGHHEFCPVCTRGGPHGPSGE